MEAALIQILPRAPKGGGKGISSGHKTSAGGGGGGVYHGGSGGGNGSGSGSDNGGNDLPVWAKVVIAVSVVWLFLYIVCLFVCWRREHKRTVAAQDRFRAWRVFWNALKYATLIQLVIVLYRKCRGSSSGSGGGRRRGVYDKIEEGQYQSMVADHEARTSGTGTGTGVGNDTGTAAAADPPAYSAAANATNDRYEPLSYPGIAPPPPAGGYAHDYYYRPPPPETQPCSSRT